MLEFLLKGRHAGVPDHCQCALSATRLWGAFSSGNVCVILLACEALVHQSSVPSTCLRTHQYSVSSSPRSPICEESLASLVHTLAPQFWQCMMGLALQSSMYCPEPHFSLAQYLKSGSCSIALRLIRLRQAVSCPGSANLSICFSEKMVRHESTQIGHRTVSCKDRGCGQTIQSTTGGWLGARLRTRSLCLRMISSAACLLTQSKHIAAC